MFVSLESYRVQYTQTIEGAKGRKYWIDDLDPYNFVEMETKSSQLELRKRRPFLLREVHMSLLLHLNEDFDDDLLLDAMRLLDRD